jgi:hypothetical protein
VLFARTTDLVQRLQTARLALAFEAAIAKLHRYDLLMLNDLSYVRKDQAETSVLFTLISSRHECRSMLITANQPFAKWTTVFLDSALTIAAIDRLVHHATVIEMNVQSYRQRSSSCERAGPQQCHPKPIHSRSPPLTGPPGRTAQHAACQRQSGATIIPTSAAESPSPLDQGPGWRQPEPARAGPGPEDSCDFSLRCGIAG